MTSRRTKILFSLIVLVLVFPLFVTTVSAAQLTWTITTVDAAESVGEWSSIALDSNDSPHISYYDHKWDDLKYAKWTGSNWLIYPAVTAGEVGISTSIALGSNDYAYISYYDASSKTLRCVQTNGVWSIITIADTTGDVGSYSSIQVDSSDRPHISYYDNTNSDLKYARFLGGNSWSIETVDSNGDVGLYSSLVLDSNNRPHIVYYDWTNQDLKYAMWTGTSWSIETVDSNGYVGRYSSLALDSNNNPHISYYDDSPNYNLKYATKTAEIWSIETVDASQSVGSYTCIAIDSTNMPHISYYDNYWGDLKYAKKLQNGWFIKNIDNVGNVGGYTAIALDSTKHAYISYYDFGNKNLKYAQNPNESFQSVTYDSFDGDGDLQKDSVQITFDIDTTYAGTLPVSVYAHLTDEWGEIYASNNTIVSINSDQPELTTLTLQIHQNAPQGNYTIYLLVDDEASTTEDASIFINAVFLYPPQTNQIGHLTGTVTEQGTGDPLSGISVIINGVEIYTNSSGQYYVDLPAGLYAVTFEDGSLFYNSITVQDVSVVAGSTTTQDMELWIDVYILELQIQGSGTLNPDVGSYQYSMGSQVEIEVLANPDPGWNFAYWMFDLVNVGSENPYSFIMNLDHVLKAVFIEQSQAGYFRGTVIDFDSGSPIPEAEIIINFDRFLTDPSGNFDLELESGEYDVFIEAYGYSRQETHVQIEAGIITVQNFSLEKTNWTLTVGIEGSGTTNPNSGEHQFSSGTEVVIEALPTEGWSFSHWILGDENIGSENPVSILMDSHRNLIANFVESPIQEYLLTMEVSGSGTTSIPIGVNGPYLDGEIVVIEAQPSEGWEFNYWLLDSLNIGNENPYPFTINENHTLTAVFREVSGGENQRPHAILAVNSTIINENEAVLFNAGESYDSDGQIMLYFFDFGDETNTGWITSSSISHIYSTVGEYTISLMVEDNQGLTSSSESTLSVTLTVIPEFSSWIILPFLIITILVILIYKRKTINK